MNVGGLPAGPQLVKVEHLHGDTTFVEHRGQCAERTRRGGR